MQKNVKNLFDDIYIGLSESTFIITFIIIILLFNIPKD